MSNISAQVFQTSGAADQPVPPEILAQMSSRLSELALILSAGECAERATLESVRRLGCHLCRQLGRAVCDRAETAASDCPLKLGRHAMS